MRIIDPFGATGGSFFAYPPVDTVFCIATTIGALRVVVISELVWISAYWIVAYLVRVEWPLARSSRTVLSPSFPSKLLFLCLRNMASYIYGIPSRAFHIV